MIDIVSARILSSYYLATHAEYFYNLTILAAGRS